MSTFQLTIVTPDGEYYHGPAESLTLTQRMVTPI